MVLIEDTLKIRIAALAGQFTMQSSETSKMLQEEGLSNLVEGYSVYGCSSRRMNKIMSQVVNLHLGEISACPRLSLQIVNMFSDFEIKCSEEFNGILIRQLERGLFSARELSILSMGAEILSSSVFK